MVLLVSLHCCMGKEAFDWLSQGETAWIMKDGFSRQVTQSRSRLRTYKKQAKTATNQWCPYGDANSSSTTSLLRTAVGNICIHSETENDHLFSWRGDSSNRALPWLLPALGRLCRLTQQPLAGMYSCSCVILFIRHWCLTLIFADFLHRNIHFGGTHISHFLPCF